MVRPRIRRIVVGVDGSNGSQRALRWAISLASAVDAEVIAVHAHQPPALAPIPTAAPALPDLSKLGESLRQAFELTWCAPLEGAGVRHRTVFEVGRPVDVLLKEADQLAADLVVTGRRGLGNWAEMLAGSVSQGVVHRAKCPVIVVPSAA